MENSEIKNVGETSPSVPFYKRMSKTNLIIAIVAFTIIIALIITTVLLSVIKVNTSVKFENTPDHIEITTGTHQLTLYNDGATKDDFNKVYDLFNQSGDSTILASIFGGYAGQGKEAVYDKATNSYSSSVLEKDGAFAVAFYWDNAQDMTTRNGDIFKYSSDQTMQYNAAFFSVSDSNTVETKTIYLRSITASTTSRYTHWMYTGVANFNNLYTLLKQFNDEGKIPVVS